MLRWLGVVVVAVLLFGCAGQPATPGAPAVSGFDQFAQGVQTEKGIAEAVLFNARVLLNTGMINGSQYQLVRDAYVKLQKTQNALVESYKGMIQAPAGPAAGQFQLNALQLIKDLQTLTQLGTRLGLIKAEEPVLNQILPAGGK
jgi:hypothetical protein